MFDLNIKFSAATIIIGIIAIFIAYRLYLKFYAKEHLRIQGSHDLRGDPDTVLTYNQHIGQIGYFPFNFGTSFPTERRRMIME